MQRCATKFILNHPFPRLSYKERPISLDLMPLEFRRDLNELSSKYRNGFVDVQFDKYLIPNSSSYNTRNSDSNNYREKSEINSERKGREQKHVCNKIKQT